MKRFPNIAPRPVTPGRVTAYERKCLPVDSPRTFRIFFDWPRVYYQKCPFKKIELSPSHSLRYASHALEFSKYRRGLKQLALAIMIKAGYKVSDAIREHVEFSDSIIWQLVELDVSGAEITVRKEKNWTIEKLERL